MKKLFTILLLILSVSVSIFAEEKITGLCIWITDGDTFKIAKGEKITNIRLWGVDAPEKQLESGSIATAILKAFIEGKRVTCIVKGKHEGRIVAQVFYKGKDIGLELLKMGAVWWADKYAPDQKDYEAAFKDSIKNKRGLWAFDQPEQPWLWRKRNKEKYGEKSLSL